MKTYPLLQSQLGVLLQSMQHPESTQYNLPIYIFMPLSVTRERLVAAAQSVVDSYPELHTRFVVGEQGEVRQWCDMSMPIPVVSRKCSEVELQAYLDIDFIRPFDLFGVEPLFRVEVIETEERLCLLCDGHHAIVDGMSLAPILATALAKVMKGESIEPQPYGMYQAAEDEVASFGTPLYQRAKVYYAQKFAGLEMATLSRSPYGAMGAMGRKTTAVSRKVCDDWCREHEVKSNLLFQAAFGHVLSVLTRQQQVAYASVHHGRMDKRLHSCVGMFVKTVPMLVNADPSQQVVDFVKSQRGELMSSIRYGVYPFTHFCSDLGMKPGIAFNFMALADMEEHIMLSDGEMRAVQPVRKEIDSDLSVDIYLNGDNYEIRVQSSLVMNDEVTLQMVAEAMRVAVCNMIAHPELTLGELGIVSDEERDALIQLGTGKHLDVDPSMTFVKAFEQQARKTPDSLAVADATDSLTYGELSHRSNILAQQLIESGVKRGDFVAVMLNRTIAFPLAVIAIHKAGAAYVPIDLDYPKERQKYMLEDCEAKVIIDDQFVAETDFAASGETADSIDLSTPDGLAYMIYTSGSTGKPKGVMIHQAGLWNFINSIIDIEHLTADDHISAHRSFSFDAHIQDLYPVLTVGGSLHIMPESIRKDLAAIRDFLFEHRITGGGYVTPIATLLLNTYKDLRVRFMTTGGEKLAGVFSDHIEIINMYGPTECTDDTSYYIIQPGCLISNIPIGRSVANCYHFIIDTEGRLVPHGAEGELCFAGVQVGCGYWHQPELTAEMFTGCPFLPSGDDGQPVRMYHTGDLCRWNTDGELEYIGRIDDQVKLRGYRVELGEIESCASRFEGISQAVAVIRPVGGTDTLCLYYTADHGATVDADELRQFMSRTLAEYMVPTVYMQLDALPTTPNGKVDRRKLPEPTLQQEAIVAPATELEQQLFDIVAQQLGTDAFGVTTNLVTLGMSSLDAMRLSMTIGSETGLRVTVSDLLDTPTVRQIAEKEVLHSSVITHHLQDHYPLTENQRGIYIDWEMNRGTTQYNVPMAICFGRQDANGLVEALQEVVDAHSYIKTRLEQQEGDVVQLRRDDAPVEVTVTDLDSEPGRDFFQQRMRPFNLFTDDLYRLEIYTYGGRTWLFKDFHHIVSDGLSDAIFFSDLLSALHGQHPQKETVTAFDYALYEQELPATDRYAEARDYFDNLLSGVEAASYPHSANGTVHLSKHVQTLVPDSEAIRKACHRMGITPNSYFQTVITQVLHSLTRQERLMLATVSNGRSLSQTENMMGMFVKTLPMVSEIAADGTTFADAAQAMHRQNIQSMSRDFYPLTEMVERHKLRPEILYIFEGGIYDNVASAFDPETDVIVPSLDTQKMPIELTVYPDREGIYTIMLGYDSSLYSQSSMEALAGALTAYAAYAVQDGILLSDIELTTEDERKALVGLGAGKRLDIDTGKTYMDYFLQRAATCPDALAVADATDTLSYSELNRYSNLIAGRLLAAGVQPQDFVGVMTERTREFPVCVFGIHKAGAAYLPLDPAYPTDRLSYMLEDSGTRILITTHDVLDAKRNGDGLGVGNVSVIYIDDIDWEGDAAKYKPVNRCTPDGYTYIIYTSGSTGKPKGAVLHQKGLLNYVFSTIDELGLTADDRISSHRSFSFDSHIEDMYPILLLGGSLHIMPESIRKDLHGIYEFIVAHQVTGGGYPTSVAKLLVNTFDLPVRYVSAIGERLTGVVSRNCRIFNFYGPTECTDHISVHLLQQGREYENIPIGHVVANNWCFIVDTQNRLLPRGEAGELCIAGIQVGIGYWKRPELTAEKFTECRFLPSGDDGQPVRMYHTGDLCRWNTDGELEYIGRIDDQVKLRGYRVELGEIENCASKFEGISQAVAIVRPVGGSDTLCLYYTADGDIDETALRQHLSRSLAEYMVPTVYMQLDTLPLTPNGKVDRRRLPAVDDSLLHADYVAPESEQEKLIVSGFERVLNQEKISVNDDFVRLGGDSLDALKLVFSLGDRGITVADVLSLRTPAAIARHAKRISVNLNKYSIESGYPLNNTQMFIYNDILKFNKYDSYLMLSAIPIDRKYTDDQIRKALDEVLAAHPVLTMHVALRDGVPYMEKGDKPAVMKGSLNPLKTLSLLTKGFDLYSSLSRHVIVRIPGRCYLVSVVHHLIFDRVSQNVFCRHFLRALEGEELGFVDDHFLKIAAFQQEVRCTEQYAEMDKYIRSMLGNLSEDNYYRNPGRHGRPGYHKRELEVDREQVNRFTERFGITKNILFTAAMSITLSKLAGNNDVVFGFLDNGRDRFNNFEDIGLYINAMPIIAHADYDDMGTFLERLSNVYYKLSQNSYFPFASLAQEFNIFPIILFQFFPDWITEDGKYDHLPQNETLINAVVSTQKDFMVEALVDVVEMKDKYTIKVMYSGYYSRKMMKKLTKMYKETINQMLKVEV